MTPQRHARIKELFLAACELPAEQRNEFVKKECGGDGDLRGQVEKLLGFCDNTTQSPQEKSIPSAAEEAIYRNLTPGTMIANRYRIVDLLGQGGMGEVYRAQDTQLEQIVALKFLIADFATHPEWLARMYQEVRSARLVTHTNVCRTFDITKANGDYFISMEYVAGENLKSLLHQIGRFPQDKALDISRQICAGLAAAHARGVLHRDLKPANIMLDDEGRVKITDFGLAGTIREIKPADFRSGTPAYMAPEQLAGKESSVRSDIYALGLILYELFTGRPAFEAQTMAQFTHLKEASQPAPPSTLVKDLDPQVENVILRCLEKDPARRPASALAVAAELPGGDLFTAALAAGQLLSPETVACVEESPQIRLSRTIPIFAAFLLFLFLAVFLSPVNHPITRGGMTKPPPVLSEKAHQLLETALPDFRLTDIAFGFTDHIAIDFLTPLPDQSEHFCYWYPPSIAPVEFWFRAGNHPIVPSDPMNVVFTDGQVGPADPKPNQPGTVNLILNLQGNLVGYESVPDFLASTHAPTAPVNWSTFFTSAGLAEKDFTPAAPKLMPRVWTDQRRAWTGKKASAPDQEIRVESAVFRNHPVFFAVVANDLKEPCKTFFRDPATRRKVVTFLRQLILVVLILVSIPLTRINLARGRSDVRGAIRLATLVFVIRMIVWLLQTHYLSSFSLELRQFALGTVGTLVEGVLVFLFYMALEPIVRQFWPQSIISWSRLTTGRFRDPLIGYNILLGSALGVYWILIFHLDRLATLSLGLSAREPIRSANFFITLLGPRSCFAFYLNTFCEAIYEGLFLLLIIALLRVLVRRPLLAGVLAVLIIAPLYVPFGSHPIVSSLAMGAGVVGVAVWVLTRFGLVPIITAMFLSQILLRSPLTFNLKAWYGDISLAALAIALAVGVFGFASSRKRSPQPRRSTSLTTLS
jgi:serine/threonine protein kinase